MMLRLLKVGFRNVLAYWSANTAALISLSLAFFTLSLFCSYVDSVRSVFKDIFAAKNMYGQVIIEKSGWQTHRAGDADLHIGKAEQQWIDAYLAQSHDVARRVRFLTVAGMITNGHTTTMFQGYGYDPKEGAAMRGSWAWDALAGMPLQDGGVESIVVGRALAHVLECQPTSHEPYVKDITGYVPKERPFHCKTNQFQLSSNTFDGQANAVDATLIGIMDGVYKEIDSKLLTMPIVQAQQLLNTDVVDWYSVELKDPASSPQFSAMFQKAAHQSGLKLQATPWQKHRFGELAMLTLQWLDHLKIFIILMLLGIVGLSVLSTILRNIEDRTVDIGTLRSMGYKRKDVLWLILTETFFLSLLGNALGFILTLVTIVIIDHLHIYYHGGLLSDSVPLHPLMTWSMAEIALWLCCLSCLASLLPALRLVHRDIPKCLGNIE